MSSNLMAPGAIYKKKYAWLRLEYFCHSGCCVGGSSASSSGFTFCVLISQGWEILLAGWTSELPKGHLASWLGPIRPNFHRVNVHTFLSASFHKNTQCTKLNQETRKKKHVFYEYRKLCGASNYQEPTPLRQMSSGTTFYKRVTMHMIVFIMC